jgi:hypothetical protein
MTSDELTVSTVVGVAPAIALHWEPPHLLKLS